MRAHARRWSSRPTSVRSLRTMICIASDFATGAEDILRSIRSDSKVEEGLRVHIDMYCA